MGGETDAVAEGSVGRTKGVKSERAPLWFQILLPPGLRAQLGYQGGATQHPMLTPLLSVGTRIELIGNSLHSACRRFQVYLLTRNTSVGLQ